MVVTTMVLAGMGLQPAAASTDAGAPAAVADDPAPCATNGLTLDGGPQTNTAALACVAEHERLSRGFLNDCPTDGRALVPGSLYQVNVDCKGGKIFQAEAVAQARFVAHQNELEGHAGGAIGPDVQWEVSAAGRIDVLHYNADSATSIIRVVELKVGKRGGAAEVRAVAQASRYARNFPNAGLHPVQVDPFSDPYVDQFEMFRSCDQGPTLQTRTYQAESTTPGVVMVWQSSRSDAPCNTGAGGTPTETHQCGDEILPIAVPCPRQGDTPDWASCMKSAAGVAMNAAVWVRYEASLERAQVLERVPVIGGDAGEVEVVGTELAGTVSTATAAAIGLGLAAGTIAGTAIGCAFEPDFFGDPHVRTLDGLAYDFQAAGEFHLLRDPTTGLDIQGRLSPLNSVMSVVGRVALNVGDQTVDLGRDGSILIDGEAADTSDGVTALEDGSVLYRSGSKRLLALSDANAVVLFDSGTVSVRLGGDEKVEGLLGDSDSNPTNDLRLSDGTPVSSMSPGEINGPYADSWRISDDESLFSYAAGESTATFTDTSFPPSVVKVSDFAAADIEVANSSCRSKGVTSGPAFEDCVYDILVSGDARYADAAAAVKGELYDPLSKSFDSSGHLSESFESPVATNFATDSYLDDPATGRVAGPVFDAKPYGFSLLDVPRHSSLTMDMRLVAYGPVDTDDLVQSAAISVDDRAAFHVDLEGQTPSTDGAASVSYVRSGTTAEGKSFNVYDVAVPVDHFGTALKVTVTPSNFRGVLDTAVGVGSVSLQLASSAPDSFDTALPLSVTPGAVNGETVAGAGNLETTAGEDDYHVHVGPGDSTLALKVAGCLDGFATLVGSDGKVVPADRPGCGDRAYRGLAVGDYTLRVWAAGPARTYSFSLSDPPAAQTFAYQLGQEVSDGVVAGTHQPGAGDLDSAAASDQYNFSVADPTKVTFTGSGVGYDVTNNPCAGAVLRRVADASGAAESTDLGPVCGGPVYRLTPGDYEVVFSSLASLASGGYSFTSWLVADDASVQVAADTAGAPVNLATTSGQSRTATFAATAGSRYRIWVPYTNLSEANLRLRVYAPDGSVVADNASAGYTPWYIGSGSGAQVFVDPAVDGTYRVVEDNLSEASAGLRVTSLRVKDLTDQVTTLDTDQVAAAGGQEVTPDLGPRQNGEYHFSAVEHGRYRVWIPSTTFNGGALRLRVYAPDGSLVDNQDAGFAPSYLSVGAGGSYYLLDTQPGVYRVVLDPQGDTTAGVTLRVAQIHDVTTTLIAEGAGSSGSGSPVSDHLAAYQNAVYSFHATAGHRYHVWLPDTQFLNGRERLRIYAPDGSLVDDEDAGYALWYFSSGAGANHYLDADQSGDYQVVLDPTDDATGTNTLRIRDTSDLVTTVPADGADLTSSPETGQNVEYRLTAQAGERFRIWIPYTSLSSAGLHLRVYAPDGSLVTDREFGHPVVYEYTGTGGDYTLEDTQAGVYRIVLDPQGDRAGDITARIQDTSDVVSTVDPDGTDLTPQLVVGQNADYRFAAQAGGRYRIAIPYTNIPQDHLHMRIYGPDGSLVNEQDAAGYPWWLSGSGSGGQYNVADAQAGVYRVVLDPQDGWTGNMTLRITDISEIRAVVSTDDTPKTVSMKDGQSALLSFHALGGHRYRIWNSDIGFYNLELGMGVSAPNGSLISQQDIGTDWYYALRDGQMTIDPAVNGTYVIALSPHPGSAGSDTVHVLDLDANLPQMVPTDGSATDVTVPAQQSAQLSFAATAGHRYRISVPVSDRAHGEQILRVYAPDGSGVLGGSGGVGAVAYLQATQTGSYQLTLDTSDGLAGSSTLRIKDKSTDDSPIVVPTDGTDAPVAFDPNMNPRLSFTAQAGHRYRVSMPATSLSGTYDDELKVIAPDGGQVIDVWAAPGQSWQIDSAQAGIYQIVLDPQENTGTATMRVKDLTDIEATIATDGTGYAVDLESGQSARLRFDVVAGHRYRISVPVSDLGYHDQTMVITAPDGTGVMGGWAGVGAVGYLQATQTGTYQLALGLTGDHDGSSTLRIKDKSTDDSPIAVPTDDSDAPVAFDPDTNPRLTFTAEAGHRYRITMPASSLSGPYDQELHVVAPDGTEIADDWAGAGYARYIASAQAGTYRIVLDPQENSGTATLRVKDISDIIGNITTDGSAATIAVAPRQNAQLTFDATIGHRYRISVASADLGYYDQDLTVFDADGNQVFDIWGGDGAVGYFQPTGSATYRISLNPYDDHAGSETIRVKDKSVDDTPLVVPTDDSDAPIAFDPNTNPRLTFTAEAGHRYRITMPAASLDGPYDQELHLIAPDGSEIADDWAGHGYTRYIDSAQAGVYKVVLDPRENTGTATLRVNDISDSQTAVDTVPTGEIGYYEQAIDIYTPDGTLLRDAWVANVRCCS